ncbi:hypothetical protein D3C79_1022350 [compost metagenome]
MVKVSSPTVLVAGVRPKWPYAAVSWYIGCSRSSMVVIAYGRRSKHSRTSCTILASEILPVPKVLIEMEVGWATPMA